MQKLLQQHLMYQLVHYRQTEAEYRLYHLLGQWFRPHAMCYTEHQILN